MLTPKINGELRARFLEVLAAEGSVIAACGAVGFNRTRMEEARDADPDFAVAWRRAEEAAVDKLERAAWSRAIAGVLEPVVSDGKIVRDDNGGAISIQRYSDELLLALLRARCPAKYGRQTDGANERRLRLLALIFVIIFAGWAIGDLAIQSMHADTRHAIVQR